MVTQAELLALKRALLEGQTPADLELKLSCLEARSVMHQFIAQNCRLLLLLLKSVYAGAFSEVAPQQCDELLRVVAYVRKDDDAIADYTTGGFADDLLELRTVLSERHELVTRFKAWRLCHQVPALWRI